MSMVEVAAHKSFQRLGVSDRKTVLADICQRSTSVLHVGAAGHDLTSDVIASRHWLHGVLARASGNIVGLDTDSDACALMRSCGYKAIVGDAEALKDCINRGDFDLVAAAEVIEHLSNLGGFLAGVRSILRPEDGRLVITTPNALRWLNCAFSLIGREVVNETHVCWYSPATLSRLLATQGFVVDEIVMYDQLEAESPLRHRLFRAFHTAFPLSAPGMVVLARPCGA